MIGHNNDIASEGPVDNIYILLRVRCYRGNVSTLAQHSMTNSGLCLRLCQQTIESTKRYYVLCLQVVATQSERMLNSSAFVTSVMIIDRIFRFVRLSG